MKNISKILLCISALIVVFASCKKDENKVVYKEGTAPVLTASQTGSIPLSFAAQAEEAVKLMWTNPNYTFTTGVSSQNVNYLLEIDTAGANFTNPKRQSISFSQDLETSIPVSRLNDYLLNQLVLAPSVPHNIEMRLKSTLGISAATLYSNVLQFTVTPYAIPPKVQPPANGTLWITGDAAPSGWSNPLGAPYDGDQKFTAVSSTVYELTLTMPGGGNYKLIQEQGVWSSQYHMITGGTWEGGDFEQKDADPGFPGPASAGTYKITVDFQRGKYTVVKI